MENINDGKPPPPPPRKYVSYFRIDGEPILPPLMTSEKRREMQQLKEKALKIEQRLRERKKCEHGEYYNINECIPREDSCSSNNQTSGNISQRSIDYAESEIEGTELSMVLLKNLIERQQGETEETPAEAAITACNASARVYRDDKQATLQKLKKSEILIYDNSTNEVIQVPAGKEKMTSDDQRGHLKEMENQVNSNYKPNIKPSHLLLAGVNTKGMTATPSICLNPPTPLTTNKSLTENLSTTESNESLINSENINQSLDFEPELSSDESFNSMITQSDIKSNRNSHYHNCKGDSSKYIDTTSVMSAKNVCAKIQQFESISSDTNTPQTSPETLQKKRKNCLGTSTGTMNRSATSPSIKITNSNRSSSSRSQSLVAQDSDNSPENALVRSSSFTLEVPSKALIEHMQQQKFISESKSPIKSRLNTTQYLTKKPPVSPLRAYRDTVESKAKKVQKVELRSSKPKIQQKAFQSKLSQSAAASISRSIPTTPTAPTQHVNSLCKTKKSPYEIPKTSHTSFQNLQKTSSAQLRKANSSNLNQSKTHKTRLTKSYTHTSTSCNSSGSGQTGKVPLNQMDKTQKEKFLQLLVQQEEEHRRLQQSFERQQRLLIEQLNREMAASPNNSYHSSSTTPTSLSKRFAQRQTLAPKQLIQLNSAHAQDHSTQQPAVNSFDSTRHNGQTNHHQASPSIINNSSYTSFDTKQSQNLNSHQHSSHNVHHTQSSEAIHLNPSSLSLTDRSNANTSLDISTLSTQTSPGNPYDSLTNQNHSSSTTIDNKTTPSSRRRLFTTETNAVGIDNDQGKKPQQLNHTDDTYRRNQIGNSLLLHAAATKINAYARGFLVRRLFQTEQIQRIVQTIRDTLIFVLNLHIETIENPEEGHTPANIKLKARLLQQLSSACRSLHLAFFQTSIKERMEIIARDRKRIKTKLMSMNRKRTPGLAA